MKIIEHRRHSIKGKHTVHLNQDGIDLARVVGSEMGKFSKVITSSHERAFETAIAMGYAVDEQLTSIMTFGQEIIDEVENWSMKFDEILTYYENRGPLYQYCLSQEKWLKELVLLIPEDSSLLIISHGGIVDYPLVHFFSNEDHESWGSSFSYCEGYKLFVENNEFVDYELFRIESK